MSPAYKKGLLIAGLMAVAALVAWLLWYVFFAPALAPAPAPADMPGTTTTPQLPSAGSGGAGTGSGSNTAGGGLPGTGAGTTTAPAAQTPPPRTAPTTPRTTTAEQFADGTVRFPHLDGNSATYYDSDNGRFFRVGPDGQRIALSDRRFYNVETVTWSSDGEKAVLEYPDGANILYNFTTDAQTTLPAHWQEFTFSPAGDQIATKSVGLDRDSRWLITAATDGGGARLIEPLGDNGDKVDVSWSPNNLSIATFTKSVDFDRQKVYFVGKNGENFKSTTVEGRGFEHEWDPEGTRMLYSVYSGDNNLKPRLWIVDAKGETIGQNRRDLGVETWAHKCAFTSNTTAYCAVPTTLPEGAGMFPELANAIPDQIYRINLATGSAVLAAQPDTPLSVHSIVVNQAGTDLYFTANNAPGMYHIGL